MEVADVRSALLVALEAEAASHEVDIVDVEIAGGSRLPIVRVRIDHADEEADTISLDEVAANNAWIEAVLDELDPFPGSYTLEVSSPGLDRPLRRARDFERFAGQMAQVVTTATQGRRKYTGSIEAVDETSVELLCDNERFRISLDEIKSAKLKPTFDAPGKVG